MTSQVLVPLDGSSLAKAVLPSAAALARATSSALTLLRVVPPLTMIEPIGGVIDRSDAFQEAYEHEPEMARQYLAGVAATLGRCGLAVQTKVMEGDPADCILEHLSANPDVQFTAMATHGRSGLGRLLFGSVAEKVLRASPVPVLMLRSRRQDHDHDNIELPTVGRSFQHILVPLDSSELAEGALEQARSLAIDTDAEITLFSVAFGPRSQDLADLPLWVEVSQEDLSRQLGDYLFEVAQRLRDDGFKVKTQVASGDPEEEIIRASDRDGIDLIVMATHGRGGLQRLWLGSVAFTVVQGANRPVLLVRVGKHAEETGATQVDKHTAANIAG